MSTMARIFTAIILFIEIKSISSLTGFELRAQQQQGFYQPQVYQEPNNGPTLIFQGGVPGQSPPFTPNIPQGIPGPYQRPPGSNGNLIIHNYNPVMPNPSIHPPYTPPGAPEPDIPSAQGPPVFTFNPKAEEPYQPPPGLQDGLPSPPSNPGLPQFNPDQMRPGPGSDLGLNPADPQSPPPVQPVPKGPFTRPLPNIPQPQEPDNNNNGPVITAAQSSGSGRQVFIEHGQVERDTFLFSTQAQVLIGTLAAFCGLCALMRCYSKCCWDQPRKRATMAHDAYSKGAVVTRQTTIEADMDWSDHTENEDDPLDDDDYDDNVLTDVQQMRSRKARELVPDESVESGIYSNVEDRLEIDQADVQILMDEDQDNEININNNKDNYPLTDDETKAIMREFKDTDDEYVD